MSEAPRTLPPQQPRPPSRTRPIAGPRARIDRLLSSGLLVLAVLATVALATTSVGAWASVRGAAQLAGRGQAEALLGDARRALHAEGPGSDPSAADLRAFLESHAAGGARWLAALDPEGAIVVEAGQSPLPPAPLRSLLASLPPGDLGRAGSWLVIASRPSPPPPRFGPASPTMLPPELEPTPPAGAPPAPYFHAAPPPPPRLALAFEPLVAEQLEAASRRALGLGLVGALALIAAAALSLRWLREREELSRQREHDGRLVALGEMSAVLAHEIRNPLASLKGHAQLLVEMTPPGRAKDKSERIVRESVRLEELVNDLLEFVRRGRIERLPTDANALLRDTAARVSAQLTNPHGNTLGDGPRIIVKDDSHEIVTWPLDAPRLGQVLLNLLRNAVQATPSPGLPVEAEAHVDRSLGALVITVRDHGPGVPAGEEERIFEPFHTTRVRGMGLGLAASRRLVALHGGTLTVANHDGGGAVFRVTLPHPGAPDAPAWPPRSDDKKGD